MSVASAHLSRSMRRAEKLQAGNINHGYFRCIKINNFALLEMRPNKVFEFRRSLDCDLAVKWHGNFIVFISRFEIH
jgi:hypothetical protein